MPKLCHVTISAPFPILPRAQAPEAEEATLLKDYLSCLAT